MKKQLALAIFTVILSFSGYSQKIIENPFTGLNLMQDFKLKKVEIRDTATILSFHVSQSAGKTVFIPKETFIQLVDGKDKLMIRSAKGVTLGESFKMPEPGVLDYQMIFPPIDPKVSKIDFGSKVVTIYDIWLRPFIERQVVKELKGNWFNRENGNWELSILDSTAVYKNKVWQLGTENFRNSEGSVTLKDGKNKIILYLKKGNEGNCQIGESKGSLKEYCQDISGMKFKSNDEPYKMPIFKRDSAILKGYIDGYSPRLGIKTATVGIKNIISAKSDSYLLKIAEDGSFSVKFPMNYPQIVFVRSNQLGSIVFMEPGKELFLMINLKNHQQLFMGGLGRLNSELVQLRGIGCFQYPEMQKKVLEIKPNEYKDWLLELKKKDMDSLETFSKAHPLSAKTYQIRKLEIEYQYLMLLMDYSMNFDQAYRVKNKIPADQRTLPVKPEELKADYYDFINNESVNNPMAVLIDGYYFFINKLKYDDLFRKLANTNRTLIDQSVVSSVKQMEVSGYPFTKEESYLVDAVKKGYLDLPPLEREFWEKYSGKYSEFCYKYRDYIRELSGKVGSSNMIMMEAFENLLTSKGISITNDEKEMISKLKALDKDELALKRLEYLKQYSASIKKFNADHQGFISFLSDWKQRIQVDEVFDKMFHVKRGIASDMMISQSICNSLEAQMTPLSDKEIQCVQQQISTPFIADYINLSNKETLAKINLNKNKSDYVLRQAPKTEADKLFDELMKNYKGKVVLVDFWATWCAPCRQGIEQIKPLKEEMAGKDVVFVYITGPSSPEQTYKNMIPDIKGEHYRVSNDEWNYLCSKFNVTGIPHQLIVDKKGEVVNSHLHTDNESIKKELENRLKEL